MNSPQHKARGILSNSTPANNVKWRTPLLVFSHRNAEQELSSEDVQLELSCCIHRNTEKYVFCIVYSVRRAVTHSCSVVQP